MKTQQFFICQLAWFLLLVGIGHASFFANNTIEKTHIKDLTLEGRISGKNVIFDLSFDVDVAKADRELCVLSGPVAYQHSSVSGEHELVKNDEGYSLRFKRGGRYTVNFSFASRPAKNGDWYETAFQVPEALVRKIVIRCDRKDLDVRIPEAVKMTKVCQENGTALVSAFMAGSREFLMRWKPAIERLDSELAMMAEANSVANVSVGSIKLTTVFRYEIIQGRMKELNFLVPHKFNVTRVSGADIQDWSLMKSEEGDRLTVALGRFRTNNYTIQIDGESALPAFPCDFALPVLVPQDVIRTNGFLAFGSSSAIKLIVEKLVGLNQIDGSAFPATLKNVINAYPSRNRFHYSFASLPYTLGVKADNIVTSMFADNQLVLTVKDNDMLLDAAIELDVRDVKANEIYFRISDEFNVSNVAGRGITDYSKESRNGEPYLRVIFQDGIIGKTIVNIKMEKLIKTWDAPIPLPLIRVDGAKTERGFLVLAVDEGQQIEPLNFSGLREVLTGSLPINVPNAVLAFRFKDSGWSGELQISRKRTSIFAEIFHLISLGENVLYGSSIITYRISGAPVNRFTLSVPDSFLNVEITGKNIRHWRKNHDIWEVILQENVAGDYTLLATYEYPFSPGAAELQVGGLESINSESESGFIAITGATGLKLDHGELANKILNIDPEEIPSSYRILVDKPILKAFKYVQRPHTIDINVATYESYSLLDLVIDHTQIDTQVNTSGEIVSTQRFWVKNASHQHLPIAMPDHANLWSVKVDNQSVRASTNHGKILIPLPRHRDPNIPILLELTYAQKIPELENRQQFLLRALKTSAQATFTQWQLTLPRKFSLDNLESNLLPSRSVTVSHTGGIPSQIANLGKQFFVDPARSVVVGIVFLSILALAYSYTHWRWRVFSTLVFGSLLAASLMNLGKSRLIDFVPERSQSTAFNTYILTKKVNLSDEELIIRGKLVDQDTHRKRRVIASILLGILSVVLCVSAFSLGSSSALVATFVAAYFACRGWPFAEVSYVLFTVCFVPISLLYVAIRWMWYHGKPYRNRAEPTARTSTVISTAMIILANGIFFGLNTEASQTYDLTMGDTVKLQEHKFTVDKPNHFPSDDRYLAKASTVNPQYGNETSLSGGALVINTGTEHWAPVAEMVNEDVADTPEPPQGHDQTQVTLQSPIDVAEYRVEVDASESLKNAEVRCYLTINADSKNLTYRVVPRSGVLVEASYDERYFYLEKDEEGYLLRARRKGQSFAQFTYLVPISEVDGTFSLKTEIANAIQHQVNVTIPSSNIEILSPNAVYLTWESLDDTTVVDALFGTDNLLWLTWHPRSRHTEFEDVVFYTETQSLFIYGEGAVEVQHNLVCQIAQGELSRIELKIPTNQHVTSVTCENLHTWRFDPSSKMLEVIFAKPIVGDHTVSINSQISVKELPYTTQPDVPIVLKTARQRGALGLTSIPSVRVTVGDERNLNRISSSDFPLVNFTVDENIRGNDGLVLFPYRYFRLPFEMHTTALKVKPEIRTVSRNQLSVGDERLVLSSEIEVEISRAGVFSFTLKVPDDYEIESLSGQGISHWDEVLDDSRSVTIHFTQKAIGIHRFNVVLTQMEKSANDHLQCPKISVVEETRHTGTLVLSSVRGIRLSAVQRQGISEVNPSELGINVKGTLTYKILQPDWFLMLRREILRPWTQVESLQTVRITDGMVLGTSYIRYRLENAGSKWFYLESPQSVSSLDITGRDVANIEQKEGGRWIVELHSKVNEDYLLTVNYQYAFDPDVKQVQIKPVEAKNVDLQKGFVVLLADTRLRISVDEFTDGLKEYDARAIPTVFGAGDLSAATHCFRSLGSTYNLTIAVNRFDPAEVLPAQVRNVDINTVVTDDGQQMTQTKITMNSGSKRFLRLRLPAESTLWSVFVNNTPVNASQEKTTILIPLEQAMEPGALLEIELIYVTTTSAGWAFESQAYHGPKFDLPLRNINWKFYLPPNAEYNGFDGTLNHVPGHQGFFTWSQEKYRRTAQSSVEDHRKQAKQFLEEGNKYAVKGEQQKAKKSFEAAMQLSNLDVDLNEDARVQLRSVQRQNAIVGLMKRRSELPFKRSLNRDVEGVVVDDKKFNDGRFSNEFARQVEQSLSLDESKNLTHIADKILDQQFAAATKVQPLQLSFPQQGKMIHFTRNLQITPEATMTVQFDAKRLDRAQRPYREWGEAAILFLTFILISIFLFQGSPGRAQAL